MSGHDVEYLYVCRLVYLIVFTICGLKRYGVYEAERPLGTTAGRPSAAYVHLVFGGLAEKRECDRINQSLVEMAFLVTRDSQHAIPGKKLSAAVSALYRTGAPRLSHVVPHIYECCCGVGVEPMESGGADSKLSIVDCAASQLGPLISSRWQRI